MFYVNNLLDLLFSLISVFISSIVSSASEILSSISCILLVILVFVVLVHLPRFSISSFPLVCFLHYLHFIFQVLNCFRYLFDCVFLGIFERFIRFFYLLIVFSVSLKQFFTSCLRCSIIFRMLHLKSIFFYFFWNRVFKSSWCVISGIWCCHVAFQVVGGILALTPAHLSLQIQPGESWCLCPVYAVTDSG